MFPIITAVFPWGGSQEEMRNDKGFLPVPPWTRDRLRAAQMRSIFPSEPALPQITVLWATCQANTLKDIIKMALGIWPGNLSRYFHSGAKLHPTYRSLCPQSVKYCQVLETPLEEMVVCILMGTGVNMKVSTSLETPFWTPLAAGTLQSQTSSPA